MTLVHKLLLINMKAARKSLGYSQMILAEKCGVSTSYIGEIEIGRKFPSARMLENLADALGMKPYQLFLDSEDKQEFDKFEVISRLYEEVRDRINSELKTTFKQYLS